MLLLRLARLRLPPPPLLPLRLVLLLRLLTTRANSMWLLLRVTLRMLMSPLMLMMVMMVLMLLRLVRLLWLRVLVRALAARLPLLLL